ncbi:hypothetical protein RIF29_38837 [Crotalaria pallida]|uniref:Uncharacterized protein n=1 Tax=Crotalaria pallida TaxID=3830 RepID=A0AAN9HLX7_CROPI
MCKTYLPYYHKKNFCWKGDDHVNQTSVTNSYYKFCLICFYHIQNSKDLSLIIDSKKTGRLKGKGCSPEIFKFGFHFVL